MRCSCSVWTVKGKPWKCTAWYSLSLPTFRRCHLTDWCWATNNPGSVSATYPFIATTGSHHFGGKWYRNVTPVVCNFVPTCKLVAGVVPGVLCVDPAGWDTVLLQVLLQVPALGFIKGVEEQGKLLDFWLCVLPLAAGSRLTDHQWTNQTRVKVFLLDNSKTDIFRYFYQSSKK